MKRILAVAIAPLWLICPVLLIAQSVSENSAASQNSKVPATDVVAQDQKVPYDQAPEPTQRVNPKYPDLATKAGIEGTVWTQVWIDESGKVTKASVTKSDAEILNQPAIDAAMQWKFKPAKKDGKPIAVWVTIPFRFKLGTESDIADYTKPGFFMLIGVKPQAVPRVIRQHPYLIGQFPSPTTDVYPESAIKDKFEGMVVLDVTVGENGRVEKVSVFDKVREDLDSAAVRLARTWTFIPAQTAGQPAKSVIRVPVGFNLPPSQK
ncbi:MAG: energy transducer TonB [Ignavibacteria bacterium]|nr:energy transducer TonB [Ignavibacteria bacterium]